MRSSQGIHLTLTDSVGLPASERKSGNISVASCAAPHPGSSKQARAKRPARIFMGGSPIVGVLGACHSSLTRNTHGTGPQGAKPRTAPYKGIPRAFDAAGAVIIHSFSNVAADSMNNGNGGERHA